MCCDFCCLWGTFQAVIQYGPLKVTQAEENRVSFSWSPTRAKGLKPPEFLKRLLLDGHGTPLCKNSASLIVGLWETRCILSMGTGHEVWMLGLAFSKGAALSSWKHKCCHVSLYHQLYLYHLSMYYYSYIYRSAMWLTVGNSRKVLRAATHAQGKPSDYHCGG